MTEYKEITMTFLTTTKKRFETIPTIERINIKGNSFRMVTKFNFEKQWIFK
jgi:hypothetical protein